MNEFIVTLVYKKSNLTKILWLNLLLNFHKFMTLIDYGFFSNLGFHTWNFWPSFHSFTNYFHTVFPCLACTEKASGYNRTASTKTKPVYKNQWCQVAAFTQVSAWIQHANMVIHISMSPLLLPKNSTPFHIPVMCELCKQNPRFCWWIIVPAAL